MYLDRQGAGPLILGPFILKSVMVVSPLRAADSVGSSPQGRCFRARGVSGAAAGVYCGGCRSAPG